MLAHSCYANIKSLRWFWESWHPRKNHFMTPLPKQAQNKSLSITGTKPPKVASKHPPACFISLPEKHYTIEWCFKASWFHPIVPYLPIVPHRYMSWLQKWGQDFATPTTNVSNKENLYQFRVGHNYHDYHEHRCFLCDVRSYTKNGQ